MDNPILLAKTLGTLGNLYNILGRYSEAIDHHEQRLQLVRQRAAMDEEENEQHRILETDALHRLSAIYELLGQKQQSLNLNQAASELAQQTGSLKLIALTQSYQSYQSIAQLDYQTLPSEIRLDEPSARSLSNEDLFSPTDLSKLEQALANHRQVLEYGEWLGDRWVIGVALIHFDEYGALYTLACAYDTNGKPEMAIAHCQQAINVARQAKTPSLEAHAWVRLGCLYEEVSNIAAAIQSFLSARQLYREANMNHDVLDLDERIKTLEKQI